MTTPLRLLLLEDRPSDAELILMELRLAGFEPECVRVDGESEYLAALDPTLDLILADYHLPQFDGVLALQQMQERGLDIPFILISGTVGEDIAVEAMKKGAADYILKDRLARLGQAVEHALMQRKLQHEKKRAEEALQASEKRFRAIIEHAQDAIVLFSADGIVQYASPSTTRLLGYLPEEVLGLNMLGFVRPDDLGAFGERFAESLRRPAVGIPIEGYVRHKDGEWRYLEGTLTNLLHEPSVGAIVNNYRDITERSQAEEALRQSEERYRILSEAAHDLITIVNRDWTISFTNTFAAQQFGAASEELFGKKLDEIFPAEIAARQKQNLQKVLDSGQPLYVEAPSVFQGETKWLGSWLVPVKDNQSGETKGILVVSRDITERKLAEETLRASERRYRALFEDMPIAIWEEDFSAIKRHLDTLKDQGITDFSAYFASHPDEALACMTMIKVLEVNNEAVRMYRAESREQLIQFTEQSVSPGELEHAHEFILALAEEKSNHRWDGTDRTLSGELIEVNLSWSVVPGHEKDYSRVIITTVDITERRRAESMIKTQLERQTALRQIDRAIISTSNVQLSLSILLSQTLSLLHIDACDVLLVNPVMNFLEYAAGLGFRTKIIENSHIRIGEGLAGRAALRRETVWVDDLGKERQHPDFIQLVREEGFVEYVGVPLIAKGKAVGVLEIYQRSAVSRDPEWLDFLESLAGQASIAIDNAQSFEGMQRLNMELVMAYDATIKGWSRAMDLRDEETEGHTRRVTELTLKLAERIGLSAEAQVQVQRGALLHDIGKLGVPDSILLKPGGLTPEEWEIMKRHPVHARDMLSTIVYLRPAMDIPYCHHEKWDGTGYPQGLAGEQIPLSARVFAVVDVWDALTSDRPYRSAWSREQTIEYIREQSGKHFDPRVVADFLEMMKDE